MVAPVERSLDSQPKLDLGERAFGRHRWQSVDGASFLFQLRIGSFDPLVEDAHGACLWHVAIAGFGECLISPCLGMKN